MLLTIRCFDGLAQRTYYHKYSETASDPLLTAWNIEPNFQTDNYIIEKVDQLGRVSSLTFMKGQNIADGFTVFGASIYENQYPNKDLIIATLKYGDGTKMDGIEAGIPYKFEYHLRDDNIIEKCVYTYDRDLSKYSEEDIKQYFGTVNTSDTIKVGTAPVVAGYQYSMARLNGSFPTAKDVNWSNIHFSYSLELYLDRRSAVRNIKSLPEVNSTIRKGYTFKNQDFSYTRGGKRFNVILEATASGELLVQGTYDYKVENVQDQNLQTAWIEGDVNYGIGEFMNFQFIQTNSTRKGFKINTVVLINGYAKSRSTWQANSRVKRLKLYHQNEPLCYINLKDTIEPRQFDFEQLLNPDHTWNGLNLQLEIVEVYPGNKYKDVAISEIDFYRYVDYVGQEK